ncbi:hypothetical protein D3C84_1230970 [compost metagenome]
MQLAEQVLAIACGDMAFGDIQIIIGQVASTRLDPGIERLFHGPLLTPVFIGLPSVHGKPGPRPG